MIASSEFIRGYTEMIVLSILSKGDSYIYSIANQINELGYGYLKITNPSLVIVLKKMSDEGKVSSFNVLNEKNVNRKFYSITERGKKYYKENITSYLESLNKLNILLRGGLGEE